jgi:hypothetical protein
MDKDLITDFILLGIAIFNATSAYLAYRTHALTKQVEVATNSMKDALVKAEKLISFAEGKAFEKKDEARQ